MADKKHIALIFGGRGLEHSVSVEGAKHLFSLIDTERYAIFPIYIDKDGGWYLSSPYEESSPRTSDNRLHPVMKTDCSGVAAENGDFIRIDCAFPLLHGDYGEDGSVQGLLTSLKIPFVGCTAAVSGICLDKAVTKAAAEAVGIPTVSWRLITDKNAASKTPFDYPIFVKPACLGSSFGAGIARDKAELREIFPAAYANGGRVLTERFVSPIRELECAYFEAQGEKIFSLPGEILCDGFYSYGKKYSKSSSAKTRVNAPLSRDIRDRLLGYARTIADFLGLRHLSRIDFFLSDEELYFNEINTMPGMTPTSLYLSLLEDAGICKREAVNRLISDAISEGAL